MYIKCYVFIVVIIVYLKDDDQINIAALIIFYQLSTINGESFEYEYECEREISTLKSSRDVYYFNGRHILLF